MSALETVLKLQTSLGNGGKKDGGTETEERTMEATFKLGPHKYNVSYRHGGPALVTPVGEIPIEARTIIEQALKKQGVTKVEWSKPPPAVPKVKKDRKVAA